MARRRHLSRVAVMQVLFERERHPGSDPLTILSYDASEIGDIDQDFACTLLTGILENEAHIRDIITQYAPAWSPERMDPISRSVLLIGSFELLHGNDAPPAVIINEAIEIAKEYGNEESGKFVNGVLNAIAHRKT